MERVFSLSSIDQEHLCTVRTGSYRTGADASRTLFSIFGGIKIFSIHHGMEFLNWKRETVGFSKDR